MRFGHTIVEHEPFSIPMIGNTATGAVIGLTPEGRTLCHRMFTEDVPDEVVAAVDERLLEHLRRGGFGEEARTGEESTLQMAYLHVTHRCNLRCVGCYSAVDGRNEKDDLPLGTMLEIVDRLAAAGVIRLVISGGEPFLRDDLAAIVAGAKEAGIEQVDVLTNGTRVTGEALEALAPWVDCISVSFDGADVRAVSAIRRENRFSALVETVKRIRAAGVRAHIIPTIHRSNGDAMGSYCALADELGATINFSLLSAPADGGELAAVLPDEEALVALARATLGLASGGVPLLADTPVSTGLCTTTGCGAGCSLVSVSADGEVFPCHLLHDEAFCAGSLRDDPTCLKRLRRPAPPVDELAPCGTCEIRYLCGGGCRARAYFATGDVGARDPYCTLMRTFYRLLFQAMMGAETGKEV